MASVGHVSVVEPGQMTLPSPDTTVVLDLADVDMNMLMDDMDTTCSPFSDGAGNAIIDSCLVNEQGTDVVCKSSIASDDPKYLVYVKHHADALRRLGLSKTKIAGSESDLNSTCGLVNIRQKRCTNMCENPSDIWYGLKMSDGTPVCIKPGKRQFGRHPFQKHNTHGKRTTRNTLPVPHVDYLPSFKSSVASNSAAGAIAGPINYAGGYLSIGKYIERPTAVVTAYKKVGYTRITPVMHKNFNRQRRRQYLARARGIDMQNLEK